MHVFNEKTIQQSVSMTSIDIIREPIAEEMKHFKHVFAIALRTDNPLLASINEYVLEGSGKQLRPILTLLAAKICNDVNEASYFGALSLELLHNASLMHDDVVDDTLVRRGRSSINARWGNKVAVLSGDYMLSNALISATKTNNLQILTSVARIGMELSDGELLQLINTQQTKITEEEYLKVIRKKTALLFATCTEVGALSANASLQQLEALRNYGEYLGICFQIKDDIFDYFNDIEIGKPTGNDLQDGKITLPLIYVLNNTKGTTRELILSIIDAKDYSKDNVDFVMKYAHDNGGVAYAIDKMNEYKNKAISELSVFHNNDVKEALIACAEFASKRKK